MHLPLSPRLTVGTRASAPASSTAPSTPRSPAAVTASRTLQSREFLPTQTKWLPTGIDWATLEAASVDSPTRHELARQLRIVTRERDRAVSNAHLNRLEASHLREERQRLHSALTRLEEQHQGVQARVAALEGELAEAKRLDQAALWHSFCTTRKKLLSAQEDLTAEQSAGHQLARDVKQEAARSQALEAELAELQARTAALELQNAKLRWARGCEPEAEPAVPACIALVLTSQPASATA